MEWKLEHFRENGGWLVYIVMLLVHLTENCTSGALKTLVLCIYSTLSVDWNSIHTVHAFPPIALGRNSGTYIG